MSKKVALVVGHNARAQGAVRATDGVSEFHWNQLAADQVRAELVCEYGVQARVFFRESGGGYAAEIDDVYSRVDDWDADCSVEFHFNGGPSNATGTETLSSGSRGSLALAEHVQKAMLDTFFLRDRGIHVRSRGDRGGRSLHAGRAPAVLVEPFFGSNEQDCAAADVARTDYAENIARAISVYLREVA